MQQRYNFWDQRLIRLVLFEEKRRERPTALQLFYLHYQVPCNLEIELTVYLETAYTAELYELFSADHTEARHETHVSQYDLPPPPSSPLLSPPLSIKLHMDLIFIIMTFRIWYSEYLTPTEFAVFHFQVHAVSHIISWFVLVFSRSKFNIEMWCFLFLHEINNQIEFLLLR